MIEVLDATNILDVLSDHAAVVAGSAFVYFENDELYKSTDTALIEAVHEYYREFLPEDLLLIIQAKNDNIIKFRNRNAARANASSWFPSREQLGELSDEYYFKCYVIDKDGICWKNFSYQN